MRVLVNKEVDIIRWNELLNKTEQGSPFQSPLYYEFLNSVVGLSASVHAVEYNDELKVLCVVTLQKEKGLKGYFSRRAIIYGGPLIKDRNFKALSILLQNIKLYYKSKAIYIEIRNFFNYSFFHNVYNEQGWKYAQHLNFQLSLENLSKAQILSTFKYNRRREIKQSIQNEAIYGECESTDEIVKVYEILKELYRTRVKLPLPPIDFFLEQNKYKIFKVFVVKHENNVIGGAFCLILPMKRIYTNYYCGIRDYHKNIYPTHLAVLATAEYAIANNIPILDFMGAGRPNEEYGVRKYKSEFGGELVEFGRYTNVLNPFLFKIGMFGIKILSKV